MKRIKLFEDFNYSVLNYIYNYFKQRIPDSDIPSETNIIEEIHGYMVYTEGWCERCFSNYGVYEIGEMIELANELTPKRLESIPNLPQYKDKFKGRKLISWRFIPLPDNNVNYGISIGIYK